MPPTSTSTTRLACVLFTDVADSTATMSAHGPAAATELRRVHDDVVARIIATHGGSIVDTNGDGVMALLPTASLGMAAALRLLVDFDDHGRRCDVPAPIRLRIGAAVGEVISEGNRHIGDAVVEAARLEALAEPGSVLATTLVATLARDVETAEIVERDPMMLKGFPSPVSVCTIRPKDLGLGPLPLPKEFVDPSSTPLIGRQAALATLERQWAAATSGRLVIGALAGEAGAGKSRLIREFARRCHAEGGIVLHGASDSELDIPYQSVADALLPAGEIDDVIAAAIDGVGPLARLFALGDRGDHEALERREVFAAVTETLARLSTRRPVLLALDDLHWARSSTAQLLHALVDELAGHRLHVIVGYRPNEIDSLHPVSALVGSPAVQAALELVDLEALGGDDVADLAAASAGRALTPSETALARRIHEDCGGSPFYVGEVLRHLLVVSDAFGPVPPPEGATLALAVPPTVRDVVVRRAESLGPEALRLLSTACVAGPSFDVDIVARAAGIDPNDALDLLELAVDRTLCREAPRDGRFVFAHDIVRSALAGRLSAARTLRVHLRLAEALEATPSPPLDELVRHWTAAATSIDHERAVHYLQLAAQRDEQALAWESAVARYEQIIDFLTDDAAADPVVVAEAWLAIGRARRATGDATYRDAMVEAGRIGRRIDSGSVLARAAIGFLRSGGWFVDATYTDERMVGLAEDALALLDGEDPLRVGVLASLATVSPFAHTLERRQEIAEEALALAERLGDTRLLVAALTAVHLTHWTPHHLDRRRAVARELTSMADRLDDTEARFLGRMFHVVADVEEHAGVAEDTFDDLVDIAAATGSFWFEFLVERLRIGLEIARAAHDPRAEIDALFTRASGTLADATGTWAAQHAEVARREGTFGSMVDALTGAAERAGPQGIWGYALVIALADADDLDEAKRRIDDVAVHPNRDYLWLVSMQMFAEAAHRTGRADLCEHIHDELAPFEQCVGMIASGTLLWGPVALSLAYAADGCGRTDLVEGHLRVAREVAERIPMPFALERADAFAGRAD